MRKLSVVFILFALTACAEVPSGKKSGPIVAPVPPSGECPFSTVAPFVGQHVSALETVMLLGKVRVIRPGQAVTMDYLPSRLNINLDSNDIIRRLTCG